jgi:hypothetical protein
MNQQQIERYVAGKMSEAEADAFENSCVANPELAKQVEFEQRLKAGLRLVASGSTAEFVRSDKSFSQYLALAASVLLFVTAGVYVWQQRSGAHPPILVAVGNAEQSEGQSMRLALVRGADGMPHLPPGMVRVEIVGLFDPGFHYTVALDRIEANQGVVTVATLFGQHPTSPVTLEVMIDGDALDSGSYFLRVRKQASDEEALDFSFIKN